MNRLALIKRFVKINHKQVNAINVDKMNFITDKNSVNIHERQKRKSLKNTH